MDVLLSWLAANWMEAVGYLGTAFTVATYAMRTMIPLRIAGILSSVAFISYGLLTGSFPVVLTEMILLPLNAVRLYQMVKLIRSVESAAEGDLSMDWLKPFTRNRRAEAGEILFRQGDLADRMYFTLSGRYLPAEAGIEIGSGQVLGEMGLLTHGNRRTQTLKCLEGGDMLTLDYSDVKQLYFQNPQFGFYFLRLVSERLMHNLERAEGRAADAVAALEARGLARHGFAEPASAC